MRSVIAFVTLLSLALITACSRAPSPSLHAALDNDAVILAFGDSITYGTGARPGQGYPDVLATLTGLRVINAGIPGETTAGGLKRLPQTVTATAPDLVILCLGGNDFLRRIDRGRTRSNLDQMLVWLRQHDIPVVLMSVPEFGLGLTGKLKPAPMYRELAEQYGLILEDDILASVLAQRALKSDSIHPNAAGYSQIASALQSLMQRSGLLP